MAKIVNDVLDEITKGRFLKLQQREMDALLHYFHCGWNERMGVYLQNEQPQAFALFANRQKLFKMTGCNSGKEVIEKFERFIIRHYKKDTRVILDLAWNGYKIDTQWLPLGEYLEKTEKSDAIAEQA